MFMDVSLQDVPVVPIAGLSGQNLNAKSTEMPWYAGHSALESLDALGEMNRPAESRQKPTSLIRVVHVLAVSGTIGAANLDLWALADLQAHRAYMWPFGWGWARAG